MTQDDEDINLKDSHKITKNKDIHARQFKDLARMDNMDAFDEKDMLGDELHDHYKTKRSTRRHRVRKDKEDSDSDPEVSRDGVVESDALRNDEIAMRLERLLKEQAELKEKAKQLLQAKKDVEGA